LSESPLSHIHTRAFQGTPQGALQESAVAEAAGEMTHATAAEILAVEAAAVPGGITAVEVAAVPGGVTAVEGAAAEAEITSVTAAAASMETERAGAGSAAGASPLGLVEESPPKNTCLWRSDMEGEASEGEASEGEAGCVVWELTRRLLEKRGPDETAQLFKSFDQDSDGCLELDEFQALLLCASKEDGGLGGGGPATKSKAALSAGARAVALSISELASSSSSSSPALDEHAAPLLLDVGEFLALLQSVPGPKAQAMEGALKEWGLASGLDLQKGNCP